MKKFKIEIKWGIIFALITLLWMWLEKSMGLHSENIDKHATLTNIFAVPAILVYVLALLDKRKRYYHDTMSWAQGFTSGLIITVIVTVLTPVNHYIIHTYISPEYFENAIQFAVDSGKMTIQEAENYFNLQSYILQSLLGAVVMGVVTSAIVAIFVRRSKKKKDEKS